jgi:hypothetical protein
VDDLFVLVMTIPLIVLIGGLIIGGMALQHRAKLRELVYKERIAMIERGLVPPPETDPAEFDRTMREAVVARIGAQPGGPGERALRHRTAGVALIALGLGLMLIIGFAGENPSAGIGVGGAIMVLGAAGLVNSVFVAQEEARRAADERRRAASAPKPPPDAGV